jgi:hypothetical protein
MNEWVSIEVGYRAFGGAWCGQCDPGPLTRLLARCSCSRHATLLSHDHWVLRGDVELLVPGAEGPCVISVPSALKMKYMFGFKLECLGGSPAPVPYLCVWEITERFNWLKIAQPWVISVVSFLKFFFVRLVFNKRWRAFSNYWLQDFYPFSLTSKIFTCYPRIRKKQGSMPSWIVGCVLRCSCLLSGADIWQL